MAQHNCVQHGEGKLLCWGPNGYGQLGNDNAIPNTGSNHPVTVIDGDGSTAALKSISTFRRTYSCEEGGTSCSADSIVLSIDSGSVGSSNSVTVKVSGLTNAQSLELHDNSECNSQVGTLDGNADPQEIAVSSLTEGLHKFHFVVLEGS